MRRVRSAVVVSVVLLVTAPAAAGAVDDGSSAGTVRYERVHRSVVMSDGVVLDGWTWQPQVRPGTRVPTVLWLSPYHGGLDPAGHDPSAGDRSRLPGGGALVPRDALMERRYALAFFSIRGTGDSGGCYDYFGPRTAEDGKELVDWLAAQPWSNGRVGMVGMSEDASTAWMTATRRPKALRTIVPVAGITDRFTGGIGTPNGLLTNALVGNYAAVAGVHEVNPSVPVASDGSVHVDGTSTPRGIARDRLCEDVRRALSTMAADTAATDRDERFWLDRRYTDRLDDIRAAVLVVGAYDDEVVGGFGPDAVAWRLLRAPKAMIAGQWGHGFPDRTRHGEWLDRLVVWLDHWLRDVGPAPAELGTVQYQVRRAADPLLGAAQDELWRESSSWPPAEARDEVLYLADGRLDASPGGVSRHLRAATRPADNFFLGQDPTPCPLEGTGVLYVSQPVQQDTTLAGVPLVHLRLSSSDSGGQVGVHLFELGPEFGCPATDGAAVGDAQLVSWGGADLRFHDGRFSATPFPDEPAHVRVVMETAAAQIETGHRVGVLVSGGDLLFRGVNHHVPVVTVHAEGEERASHIVLPVVDDPTTARRETVSGGHRAP